MKDVIEVVGGKVYAAAPLINGCADIYEKGEDGQTAVLDYCRGNAHTKGGRFGH